MHLPFIMIDLAVLIVPSILILPSVLIVLIVRFLLLQFLGLRLQGRPQLIAPRFQGRLQFQGPLSFLCFLRFRWPRWHWMEVQPPVEARPRVQ